MTTKEKEAWNSSKEVVTEFFGNETDPNFEHLVDMIDKFNNLGSLMSLAEPF